MGYFGKCICPFGVTVRGMRVHRGIRPIHVEPHLCCKLDGFIGVCGDWCEA